MTARIQDILHPPAALLLQNAAGGLFDPRSSAGGPVIGSRRLLACTWSAEGSTGLSLSHICPRPVQFVADASEADEAMAEFQACGFAAMPASVWFHDKVSEGVHRVDAGQVQVQVEVYLARFGLSRGVKVGCD
jgi:hypothetical protein